MKAGRIAGYFDTKYMIVLRTEQILHKIRPILWKRHISSIMSLGVLSYYMIYLRESQGANLICKAVVLIILLYKMHSVFIAYPAGRFSIW